MSIIISTEKFTADHNDFTSSRKSDDQQLHLTTQKSFVTRDSLLFFFTLRLDFDGQARMMFFFFF